MTFEHLQYLKKHHQSLRLLNSDNFAMVVSFFYFVFVQKKHLTIEHSALLHYLEEYLYNLNQTYDNLFPKNPKEYLDDFVSQKHGYLKKYHSNNGELLYEPTPYTQKTFEILESLEKKEFVGSQTKFAIIFELLEELEFETTLSDKERIAVLEQQKHKIEKQIEKIKTKQDLRFDESHIKEHFMLLLEQSRKLKYDFAEIEQNFRELNQKAMEKIAGEYESKDSVLGSIFDTEDAIRQSDQGKSFFAFWQLLSDSEKNEKLSTMLHNLYKIKAIEEIDKQQTLKNFKFELLANADKITKVSAKLIEQLRRFIDDRIWIENKKILELCKSCEKSAISIKQTPPKQKDFMCIDDTGVKIESVFDRKLYEVKKTQNLQSELIEEDEELDIDTFLDIFYIDEEELKRNITTILQHKPQCTIEEISLQFPITKGISELIGYLSIAKNNDNAIVDEDQHATITIEDPQGMKKKISVPYITYTRAKQ